MATIQQLLDDINLRYRNTFSTDQLVKWMDTVQRQIYQDVKHEALPYNFTTLSGTQWYALPSDCDPMGIKSLDIETKTGSGKYEALDFMKLGMNETVSDQAEFYTVYNGNLFINPNPTDTTAGRNVYLYYNKRPAALSSANLSATPDLNEDYHELLVFGTCERIAAARKDSENKSNYANDFSMLFSKYKAMYKVTYPEYTKPRDMLPKRGLSGVRRRKYYDTDLLPK